MSKRVIRLWVYFKRGHSNWMAFLFSLANFIVIQYSLLVERVGLLRSLFPNIAVFTLALLLVYVPTAILVGRWDYKRASVPAELELSAYYSPWNQDLARALILIARGETEEAEKILRRWLPEG